MNSFEEKIIIDLNIFLLSNYRKGNFLEVFSIGLVDRYSCTKIRDEKQQGNLSLKLVLIQR